MREMLAQTRRTQQPTRDPAVGSLVARLEAELRANRAELDALRRRGASKQPTPAGDPLPPS